MDNPLCAMGFKTWVNNSKQIGEDNVFLGRNLRIEAANHGTRNEKKKILCNRVFQRIVNRQLVCAWEEWRHHVKIQNLLHRISARFRSHGKSRTMNTWIAYVRYRKYSRDLANRFQKRLDNRGLSAAWTQWQAFVRYDRYKGEISKIQNEYGNEVAKLKQQIMEQDREKKKILCNRVFQRIVNRQLVCAWEEWRHHVKTQNLLHQISARFRSHGKSRTMNTWIAYVRYRKYSRDLANRVFKRLDNRGLSAAWTQWQAFVFIDKIQNEHGNEVAKLKQQIMEQEHEKKKYFAITECSNVL